MSVEESAACNMNKTVEILCTYVHTYLWENRSMYVVWVACFQAHECTYSSVLGVRCE